MRRAETDVVRKLGGGDWRSLGRADEVASEIARDPKLFAEVFQALLGDDLIVCRRAADAIEKASRSRPDRRHGMLFAGVAATPDEVRRIISRAPPRWLIRGPWRIRSPIAYYGLEQQTGSR